MSLTLSVDGETRLFEPDAVIVAGYTGRDRVKVQHHIDELKAIGVPPPPRFPMYWVLPPWLLTDAASIVVAGTETSGEAELCLLGDGDERFVALGSDHTDRAAEAVDIELSKAICPVPVSRVAWRLAEVDGHWDELFLRSWIDDAGAEVVYQDDVCASLVSPLELLAAFPYTLPPRWAMLTGTVPVRGPIRPSTRFRAELFDPVRDRSIDLEYRVEALSARFPLTDRHGGSD